MEASPAAVDLFAGAGGTSQGLKAAGYRILLAIENDPSAVRTYRANHADVDVIERDIRRVQAPALARRLDRAEDVIDLLTACPPCQGFSSFGSSRPDDPRNQLVVTIGRFVEHLKPRAVLIENVPRLAYDRRLARLTALLDECYTVSRYTVDAADFGVPQHRRRMIVIAVHRDFGIELPADIRSRLPADFDIAPKTAGAAIAPAGDIARTSDSLHRARRSSERVQARIRSVPHAGSRFDLPEEHRLVCHSKLDNRSATASYGRIDAALPAPTMTTRCTTPACGRFIHPQEHRGLSLREAALLQTFPHGYAFDGNYGEIERQIGNAVPVRLAHALGLVVRSLVDDSSRATKAA